MSDVRLYVDEDASERAVIRELRARGADLLTSAEVERLGSGDSDQLAFAVQHARSIYTFNVGDFARLHREYLEQGRDHCGIVVIPDQRCSIGIGDRQERIFAHLYRHSPQGRGKGQELPPLIPVPFVRFSPWSNRSTPHSVSPGILYSLIGLADRGRLVET